MSHLLPHSYRQIIDLCRRMVREVVNGAQMAARYMQSLGWDFTVALAVIQGA